MQTVPRSQPKPPVDILAKIDQVYHHHRTHLQIQQQQTAVRQRKRLVQARAAFQRELNRSLGQHTQTGLGIRIDVDASDRDHLRFVASFRFEGKLWLLTGQRRFWGYDWFFKMADSAQVTRCSRQTLEAQLCFALGHRRHQVHRVLEALEITHVPPRRWLVNTNRRHPQLKLTRPKVRIEDAVILKLA